MTDRDSGADSADVGAGQDQVWARPMVDLEYYLGSPLPEVEIQMWTAMSSDQRLKAQKRILALHGWNTGEEPKDAGVAAGLAELSVTRFYEMAKVWKTEPSLGKLGIFAAAPRSRKGKNDGRLRELAKEVVSQNPDHSVRRLALAMQTASDLGEATPSFNTLRRFIDDELRDTIQKPLAGEYISFDYSGCWFRDGGSVRTFALFAIVDLNTQLIIGASLGRPDDVVEGYRLAAIDAQQRLDAPVWAEMAWASDVTDIRMSLSAASRDGHDFQIELLLHGVRSQVKVRTKEEEAGRYLRRVAGTTIGRITLATPRSWARTPGEASEELPTPTLIDIERLSAEVNAHNELRAAMTRKASSSSPPEDLVRAIGYVAALRQQDGS